MILFLVACLIIGLVCMVGEVIHEKDWPRSTAPIFCFYVMLFVLGLQVRIYLSKSVLVIIITSGGNTHSITVFALNGVLSGKLFFPIR